MGSMLVDMHPELGQVDPRLLGSPLVYDTVWLLDGWDQT